MPVSKIDGLLPARRTAISCPVRKASNGISRMHPSRNVIRSLIGASARSEITREILRGASPQEVAVSRPDLEI